MSTVEFTVYGVAQPAGSKRAFVNRNTGKAHVTDAAKGSRAWKQEVAAAAAERMFNGTGHRSYPVLTGPLALTVIIYVPRPKGHYGRRGLLPSAPAYPTKRPDLTKLVRGIEDALTGVVWRDDAQVVEQYARKFYGEPVRVEVTVDLHMALRRNALEAATADHAAARAEEKTQDVCGNCGHARTLHFPWCHDPYIPGKCNYEYDLCSCREFKAIADVR